MKIEKTTCPCCGANIKILPGQKSAECEYCSSSVLISGMEHDIQGSVPSNTTGSGERKTDPVPFFHEPVKHAILPPLGFRSKNILHMITAVCGYLFILYVASGLGGALDFVFFTVACLSAVDICTDWTGIFSRLGGLHSGNALLRIASKVIWSIVIFVAWIVLMAIIELILNS